ncbi:MAG: baseplate J/gp47 family protein [Rhodospirillales bacterium]|nr:baseplate J/gp47 family protein [Rhodospirillales bacterium]
MTGFTAIDLSKLPPPAVIQGADYEALLAEMKAEAVRRLPELETALSLESEPAAQLLRVCAYYRMLDRLEFNDGARACMLALSTGTDLDGLGAFWGVERLILQAADDGAVPPVPAILESDEAFRKRIQLSLEGHTTAGPRGAYIFWALSASSRIEDVAVTSPRPGEVLVTVLARDGEPAGAALLGVVRQALGHEDVRPLTDRVTVEAASIVPYEVTAALTLYHGPDAEVVRAAALAAVQAYTAAQHRIGHDITRSGLFAALHREGVQNVALTGPAADIAVDARSAARCSAIEVSVAGRDV